MDCQLPALLTGLLHIIFLEAGKLCQQDCMLDVKGLRVDSWGNVVRVKVGIGSG